MVDEANNDVDFLKDLQWKTVDDGSIKIKVSGDTSQKVSKAISGLGIEYNKNPTEIVVPQASVDRLRICKELSLIGLKFEQITQLLTPLTRKDSSLSSDVVEALVQKILDTEIDVLQKHEDLEVLQRTLQIHAKPQNDLTSRLTGLVNWLFRSGPEGQRYQAQDRIQRTEELREENAKKILEELDKNSINIDRVLNLIEDGVDLKYKDRNGKTVLEHLEQANPKINNTTLLRIAVEKGRTHVVKALVVAGADVNALLIKELTQGKPDDQVLIQAIRNGADLRKITDNDQKQVLGSLIERNINDEALVQAYLQGGGADDQVVKALLLKEPDVENLEDRERVSAFLIQAIRNGADLRKITDYDQKQVLGRLIGRNINDKALLQAYLQGGGQVRLDDPRFAFDLLESAIIHKKTDSLQIIAKALSPQEKQKRLDSALSLACSLQDPVCVEQLLAFGANVSFEVLHAACSRKRADIVQMLLEQAVKQNVAIDPSLLKTACLEKPPQVDIIRTLLDAKIKPPDGLLEAAWKNSCFESVVMLLARHENPREYLQTKDINTVDSEGCTLLHYACMIEEEKVARLLLTMGADVNKIDKNNHNALFTARHCSYELVCLLADKTDDFTLKDSNNYTILSVLHVRRPIDWKKKIEYITQKMTMQVWQETARYSEAFDRAKVLGHAFEMKGTTRLTTSLGESQVSLEMLHSSILAHEIAENMREFATLFPVYDQEAIRAMAALQFAAEQKTHTPEEYLRNIQNGEPVFFLTGTPQHAVCVCIFKDRFMICNRGGYAGDMGRSGFGGARPPTLETFGITPNTLTKETIGYLLALSDYTSLYDVLPQKLKLSRDDASRNFDDKAKLPSQVANNCAWASVEGAMKAYFFLASNDKGVEYSEKMFINWQFFQQITLLEKYMNSEQLDKDIISRALVSSTLQKNLASPHLDPRLKDKFESLMRKHTEGFTPQQSASFRTSGVYNKALSQDPSATSSLLVSLKH